MSNNLTRRQLRQIVTDGAGKQTWLPTRKVVFGAIGGIAGAVALAVLTAVTPDMLAGLGPSWSVLVYAGVTALVASLSSYFAKNGPVS